LDVYLSDPTLAILWIRIATSAIRWLRNGHYDQCHAPYRAHPGLPEHLRGHQGKRSAGSVYRETRLAFGWSSGSSKLELFEGFVKHRQAVQAQPKCGPARRSLITEDEGGGYYDSGYIQPVDFFGDGTRIPAA